MTNRQMLINLLEKKDARALALLECPPNYDGCPEDETGELVPCEQCQAEWLDAEVEE